MVVPSRGLAARRRRPLAGTRGWTRAVSAGNWRLLRKPTCEDRIRQQSGHSASQIRFLKSAVRSSRGMACANDPIWDDPDVRTRHVERRLLSKDAAKGLSG